MLVKKHHDSNWLAASIMLFQSWAGFAWSQRVTPPDCKVLLCQLLGNPQSCLLWKEGEVGCAKPCKLWCPDGGQPVRLGALRFADMTLPVLCPGQFRWAFHSCPSTDVLDEELATLGSATSCMFKRCGKAFLVKSETRRDVLKVGEEMMSGPSQP